jgi:hypothetical protein
MRWLQQEALQEGERALFQDETQMSIHVCLRPPPQEIAFNWLRRPSQVVWLRKRCFSVLWRKKRLRTF